MKAIIKTKPFLLSLSVLFLGVLSLVMENIFYGTIDENGVLQESFFLPLGSVSVLLGVVGMLVSILWFYLNNKKKSSS